MPSGDINGHPRPLPVFFQEIPLLEILPTGTGRGHHRQNYKISQDGAGRNQSMPLSRQVISRFLKKVAANLRGDFVIIGGSVPLLLNLSHRITLDIDLAKKGGLSNAELFSPLNMP